MWTESNMSFIQSLAVFGMGFCVVFLILIILALAIMVFSRIFSTKESAGQTPAEEKKEDDILAVLIAAVSEEVNLPIDRFRITGFREI
ncbi:MULTISPECIES: hypothetical protein [Acutalibacteraceae]|uniref:hypothetical protein n=1 Tax=Acutalibacteraceae TaxID=3082771 RepID=UPI0013E8AEB1|nr:MULTISPECIES: hypothetical protein [Acutalibacteraceae]